MVRRFVAGEALVDATLALENLRAHGLRTTVDVLGESVTSSNDGERVRDAYLELLGVLAEGPFDRNVSLKLTAFGLDLGEETCATLARPVFARAHELGAFVRIDMEDHTKTDAILRVWGQIREACPDSGVVIQAALRRSEADLDYLIGEQVRIRLCKGAYREPSTVAHQDRHDVDAAYEQLMYRLLAEGAYPALATHDDRLIDKAIAFAQSRRIEPDRFEFQMLHGVRRDLQARLVAAGWTVRVYVPFGTQWFPYFMRRLAERPANVGFLLRSLVRELPPIRR